MCSMYPAFLDVSMSQCLAGNKSNVTFTVVCLLCCHIVTLKGLFFAHAFGFHYQSLRYPNLSRRVIRLRSTLSTLYTKTYSIANSVDPDETAHQEPSHLALHC